ncbi:ribonuclease H-like domain-containing protein [Tanacetum coccineum]
MVVVERVKKNSIANISLSTASATTEVSTAAKNLLYIRKSVEKRIDKGKAIMKEDESIQKKVKKQLKQERLGYEKAIRLQEHINEEERQRIARDSEIAKQLQEEFDRARQEQEVVAKADQAHDIDWSDPTMLRYHALQNRSFSIAEVRKNMCIYLKNQGGYKQSHFKGISYEDIRLIFERSSKKRSREDSDEDNAKKQKLEDDAEKEELRDSMDVVPRDDIAIDVESLATKYPIVDWKTHVLTENMMYYQLIRADGSSKYYKIFSEMLDDFDRQDVMDLHRLVQERYDTTSPEGYDLLLWGDLKILFEPNEEDEIWKNQQDYNLISWRLFDSCGIHILLMHTGIAIHMMIEKKYPLTQEMLSRMLSRRLEVDQESEMAFELLSSYEATNHNIKTDNGTEFVNQILRSYYEEVGISHRTFVARTPQQNGVVKRWNHTFVEAAHTMLIFLKALLFLGAEAPMFDEYLNSPPCIDSQVPVVIALEHAVSTSTPSSTTSDQDAPSTSTLQTTPETTFLVIHLDIEEADHDIEVAHMDNNSSFDNPILEPSSEESSS